jgi:hypothetical protein
LATIGESDDSIIDEGSAAYLRGALLKILELDGETEGVQELSAAAQWTGIMGQVVTIRTLCETCADFVPPVIPETTIRGSGKSLTQTECGFVVDTRDTACRMARCAVRRLWIWYLGS